MINILFTKIVDHSTLDKTYFSVNSYDFLSIEYFILKKKPFLNNNPLIFTSCNGFKGFLLNFRLDYLKKKIYVVGDKTFFYVKKYFPFSFFLKKNYVEDLIEEIIKEKSHQNYDWFCGNKTKNLYTLKSNNINQYKVYQTTLIPRKIENLSHYNGIVFFSPSGVESFFLNNNIKNNIEVFAIGKTTAKFISNFFLGDKKKIWYPLKPSLEKIFSLIKDIFKK
ncbi:uroporphyrinogen-III synthase [Blattabacterium cuenoti]|uniref:uroporphyrinogen-III synthase n=1 Tax=Blattabacterium cuenoti TaxID=1653831 RepID=UPI00163B7F13|nr:uroporphyrinogen-III synthase [Blattabacterium cuenoti]